MPARATATRTLAALALASALAPTHAQDAPLTGQELQEAWAGKELLGSAANGSKLFMRLEKDGSATLSVGSLNDTGAWRVQDGGYCAKWAVIRKGEERCFKVVRQAGGYKILNEDGSVSGYINGVR